MEIVEADETRNPEFPNSFEVNNEFAMVTVLELAQRKTMLENSEDMLGSIV